MRQKALSQTCSLKTKAFYLNFHNEISRLYFSCKIGEIRLKDAKYIGDEMLNTFILHV